MVTANAPFGFLALPGPGDDLARTLSGRVRTVAFKALASFRSVRLAADVAPAFAAAQAAITALATRDRPGRDRVAAVFDDVDVRACALTLASAPDHANEAARTIAPMLRAALDRTEPPDRGPVHPITDALPKLRLVEIDINPLRSLEAHPDKHGNALDLGGRTVAEWTSAVAGAIELIAAALPELGAELATTFQRLVPVGFDEHEHLSCSYREAPGLVYMTLHPNVVTMAEAIVHEAQHGKLNLLSWLDPVLDNPPDELVTSPVRPDPRPLMGVLLAAHAFVPVAWLHRRLAELGHPAASDPWFPRRREQVIASNAEALEVIAAHARPTATGARVIRALNELHRAVA